MARVFQIPGVLTSVYTSAVVPLGTTYEKDSGQAFMFLYNAGADSTAAGDVTGVYDSTGTTFGYVSVTAATLLDYTDGTTIRVLVAGIAMATVATTQYGWFWFRGYGTDTITTDGTAVKAQGLVCADGLKVATTNATAGTAHQSLFGVAYADDVSTSLNKANLFCNAWGG